jgi:hypothetical protein
MPVLARDYPELERHLALPDRPADLVAEGFRLDIRVGQVQQPHVTARWIAANSRIERIAWADMLKVDCGKIQRHLRIGNTPRSRESALPSASSRRSSAY